MAWMWQHKREIVSESSGKIAFLEQQRVNNKCWLLLPSCAVHPRLGEHVLRLMTLLLPPAYHGDWCCCWLDGRGVADVHVRLDVAKASVVRTAIAAAYAVNHTKRVRAMEEALDAERVPRFL